MTALGRLCHESAGPYAGTATGRALPADGAGIITDTVGIMAGMEAALEMLEDTVELDDLAGTATAGAADLHYRVFRVR